MNARHLHQYLFTAYLLPVNAVGYSESEASQTAHDLYRVHLTGRRENSGHACCRHRVRFGIRGWMGITFVVYSQILEQRVSKVLQAFVVIVIIVILKSRK